MPHCPPDLLFSPRALRPQAVPASERLGLAGLLEPLQEVCKAHAGGKGGYAAALCTRLIQSYLEVGGWAGSAMPAVCPGLLVLACCCSPACLPACLQSQHSLHLP